MMAPDHIEAARMIRFPTAWDRLFHQYDLLTEAGLSDAEALRISVQAEADRVAELTRQEAA